MDKIQLYFQFIMIVNILSLMVEIREFFFSYSDKSNG
jgi:hypothetical protein